MDTSAWKGLGRLLAREQRAYLRRDRAAWGEHLERARAFFGEGLDRADPARPVLILGAGTGLEIPWRLAPPLTTGWDADPWSRAGTALRHRRFPPWVFEDLTGGLGALGALTRRCLHRPDALQRRPAELAIRRLAGLLLTLQPDPAPLRDWIAAHRPGTILAANVLGQVGCVAERLVEGLFRPARPWPQDPEAADPLAEALDAWTFRALQAVCSVLDESGADLWLLHDRAVLHGSVPASLGPIEVEWTRQLRSATPLDASDPLAGLDLLTRLGGPGPVAFARWLWPVAPGQVHLMEALTRRTSGTSPSGAGQSV